jgi:hypothetical protein
MITFRRFGHVEEKEKEKEIFLEHLNDLMHKMNGTWLSDMTKYKEIEIIKPLKEIMKKKVNSNYFFDRFYKVFLSTFLSKMGLSYYNLTQKEKEEILDMDFTYENWEKKSIELINNFIGRIKNVCPQVVWFCFDDIYFVFHIQYIYKEEFKFNNLFKYIRDYFIFDNTINEIKEYRNQIKYNEIKKKIIKIYPIIKKRYGMNKFLEKILSYFTNDTDYNFEETRKILDNYDNNKNNNNLDEEELIKLKNKKD